jgi:hypothetical protein
LAGSGARSQEMGSFMGGAFAVGRKTGDRGRLTADGQPS